jgi:hypothetical protein
MDFCSRSQPTTFQRMILGRSQRKCALERSRNRSQLSTRHCHKKEPA